MLFAKLVLILVVEAGPNRIQLDDPLMLKFS